MALTPDLSRLGRAGHSVVHHVDDPPADGRHDRPADGHCLKDHGGTRIQERRGYDHDTVVRVGSMTDAWSSNHPVAVMDAVALGRKVVVADNSGLSELAAEGLAVAVPVDAPPRPGRGVGRRGAPS